jgi:hypothetical protein
MEQGNPQHRDNVEQPIAIRGHGGVSSERWGIPLGAAASSLALGVGVCIGEARAGLGPAQRLPTPFEAFLNTAVFRTQLSPPKCRFLRFVAVVRLSCWLVAAAVAAVWVRAAVHGFRGVICLGLGRCTSSTPVFLASRLAWVAPALAVALVSGWALLVRAARRSHRNRGGTVTSGR